MAANTTEGVRRTARVRALASAALLLGVLAVPAVVVQVPERADARGIEPADVDRSVGFDGVSQRALASSTSFDIVNDITISAWVKPDTTCSSGQCRVIVKDVGYGIWGENGVWNFQFRAASGLWSEYSTRVAIRAGEWVHLALTRVKSSGAVTFYVNGSSMYTTTYSTAFGTSTDVLSIGGYTEASTASATSQPFDGEIDEVRLWNVVRTRAQIQSDMVTWGPADASGLVGYWDFNDDSNTIARNRVPGASPATHLTLVNMPAKPDVKTVSTAGSNTVVSFPRTYLNAAGGWRVPEGTSTVTYLAVGGGGGGGAHVGGGGGGGGVLSGSGNIEPSSVVPVTVGAAGIGGLLATACSNPCTSSRQATNGTDSTLGLTGSTVTAIGGGSGGHWNYYAAGSGGSGGGSGHTSPAAGAGTSGQGSSGGVGYPNPPLTGGGGGGAGGTGTTATASQPGNGGVGVSSSITGTALFYGGGGGGGFHSASGSYNPGTGGSGVGGDGAEATTTKAGNGWTGRGGGGGGGGNTNQSRSEGGDGGSGVVIVSFATSGNTCETEQTVQGAHTVVAFKNVGTCTWSVPVGVATVDYLVVAGGGGGASRAGGGGGAGGYLTSTARSLAGVSTLTVTVGAGGVGATAAQSDGNNGWNSVVTGDGSFATVTAIGGGAGGAAGGTAGTGGSGGGAGGSGTLGGSQPVGGRTVGQGNVGGAGRNGNCAGSSTDWCGGGGGGAGAAGGAGALNGAAGSGGAGLAPSWLSATSATRMRIGEVSSGVAYFAGGGGGGADAGGSAGAGGVGGGGAGSISHENEGVDAVANTGGGGGGSGYHSTNGQSAAGDGGSGVVVLRYTTLTDTQSSLVDSAAVLNGSSQYFQVAEGTAFVSRATYTVESWIYPTSVTCSTACPFMSHDGDYIVAIEGGVFKLWIYHTSTGQLDTWATEVPARANEWQHVALVRDGAAATLYVNGQVADAMTLSGSTRSTYSTAYALKIGWHYSTQFFAGRVDQWRYWSVARTQAQIESSMHEHTPSAVVGLVAQYDFNGVTGTTVANTAPSAAANTSLTAYGTPTYSDVKSLSESGLDAVVTFPRSYLTAAGGWTVPANTDALSVLVVGGGGGGGTDAGGGGGGGGTRFENNVTATAGGLVSVKVGAGGRGGSWSNTSRPNLSAASGQSSVVTWGSRSYTGGGGGGGQGWLGASQGVPAGGSGGTGSGNGTGANGAAGGNGPASVCSNTLASGISGGNGTANSLSGSSVVYGGGGGGGFAVNWDTTTSATQTGVPGGTGGGGRGADWNLSTKKASTGYDGTSGLGGGGGGSHACGNTTAHSRLSGHRTDGGKGGSGVVVLTYTPTEVCAPVTTRHGVYKVYEFRSVTTCEWDVPTGVTSLDYLVVAGGGGGGAYNNDNSAGGGGGAGGVLDGTGLSVTAGQTLTLTTGAGGAGGFATTTANNDGNGSQGSNSSVSGTGITTITAIGGGFGGAYFGGARPYGGGDGGSGGGSLGSQGTSAAGGSGTAGPPRQGYNGGANNLNCGVERPAGGGGGAGGAGGNASCIGDQSGHGGVGRVSSITGASVVYAGGGGGGSSVLGAVAGNGGLGGGGNGGAIRGADGVDGLGGGGGGAGYETSVNVRVQAGTGGDGVVIVRHVDRTLSVSAGNNQTTAPSAQLSTNPKVRVTDPAGNGVDGIPVTFAVTAGGGTAGATTVISSGGGYAETTWTVGTSGAQTMTATMAIVDSNTVTFTATITTTVCDVGFDELHFDFSNKTVVSAVDASTPGFRANDKILFHDIATKDCDGVSTAIDALVTTSALVSATIKAYEANAKAGGTNSYFQADVDISAANGYAEFGFQFYESGTYGTTNERLTLKNVKITAIDIDYYQYNYATGLDAYTVASNTRLTTTRTPSSGFPADVKFQGVSGYYDNDPRDQVVMTYGEVLDFSIRFGRSSSGSPNYFGVAFKELGWGASSAVTVGEEFTLTYDANGAGGGTAPSNQTAGVGATVTTASNTGSMTKTGHTFAGWNTAANGSGTTYLAGANFSMPQGGDTLYAVWTPTNYSVVYNANGGSGAPATQTAAFNSTVTAAAAGSIARTGYTFAGWNTAANGSGTAYTAGSGTFTMPAANVALYAQWTINQYTVTYDANNGSSPPSSQTANAGTSVTVAAAGSMTRTGHTFAGWNTAANGSGTSRAAGSTFTLNANVTLYAQWTVNQYTLTYNANGGTSAPASSTKSYDATVTVAAAGSMTRAGHDFAGWNTAANGSGTARAASATFNMPDANVTLYAQWTPRQHDVIYDPNDTGLGASAGSIPTTQANNNYGSTVNLSANTPTLTGYTFNGWNTAANGSGTAYLPADSLTQPDADVTLYAQWVADIYDLIYNANGGVGAPSPGQFGTGSTATVSATEPTRVGYDFSGWNEAANGTGTDRNAGGTFTMPASDVTLYAKWTIRSFSVIYNGNGGGGVPMSQSVQYNATVTVSAQGSTARSGYSFTGWNTAANGSGTAWSGGGTFAMPASNVTLYAQWAADVFTVSYDANGGTGAPSSQVAGTDSTVTAAGAGSMARSGYSFTGWNTVANGTGTQRLAAATFAMPASNVTLYAQWSADVQTITYDANGGSGAPGSATSPTDAMYTVSGSTPSRTGYTFAGWNTAANGSGADYVGGDTLTTPASALTLYAKWTPNIYAVTYDANGGSGAPATQNEFTAATVTVTSTAPTRAGYSLVAWNTAADGTGTVRAVGGTFAMPAANVTLYAQWIADTQRIFYNANGGTGAPAGMSSVTDATVTVSSTAPTRTGYVFAGWNTSADGNGTSRSAGDPFTTPAANVTLYAQWTPRSYVITYDANNGLSAPNSQIEQYLTTTTLSATPAVRTGYIFMEWNTAADGSGASYLAGGSLFMPASDVTLYAQWQADTFDLYFVANGGSNAPTGETASTGDTVTMANKVTTRPTRTGYSFTGWNTAADGSGTGYAWDGTNYTPSTFVMPAGDVFFFAQWTAVAYTVAYDANGGTGSGPASSTANYLDIVVVDQPTGFSRNGFTFAGWNEVANGSGTDHAPTQSFVMPAANVTLYAKWQANVNAIVFNATGGTGEPDPQFGATSESKVVPVDEPTREGHTFDGWVDSQGNPVNPGDTFVVPATSTMLFAQWSINSYSLAYDANGGTGAPTGSTVQFASTVTVSSVAPTRKGYTFSGWNTAANGAGTVRSAGASFAMPAENVTLFAQWAEIPSTTTTTTPAASTPPASTTTVPTPPRDDAPAAAVPADDEEEAAAPRDLTATGANSRGLVLVSALMIAVGVVVSGRRRRVVQ